MIIAITGQMRSGTSAVAQIIHLLGIPVAVHTPAPMPPTWRFDWEDSLLSQSLTATQGDPDSDWFIDHLKARMTHATELFRSDHIALKSPFLCLTRDLLELCADVLHETVYWIILRRPQAQIEASMDQFPFLDFGANERIKKRLSEFRRGGVRRVRRRLVDYEELVANPRAVVLSLIESLGIDPHPDAVERAVRSVLTPTTKKVDKTWQS